MRFLVSEVPDVAVDDLAGVQGFEGVAHGDAIDKSNRKYTQINDCGFSSNRKIHPRLAGQCITPPPRVVPDVAVDDLAGVDGFEGVAHGDAYLGHLSVQASGFGVRSSGCRV